MHIESGKIVKVHDYPGKWLVVIGSRYNDNQEAHFFAVESNFIERGQFSLKEFKHNEIQGVTVIGSNLHKLSVFVEQYEDHLRELV